MENKTFDDLKANVQEKVSKACKATANAVHQGIEWGVNNPEKVIAVAGIAVAAMKASQSLVVSHRVKAERQRIDHTYYDPSTGFHWELRRAATNADRAKILERKANGEQIVDILKDLKLIKM